MTSMFITIITARMAMSRGLRRLKRSSSSGANICSMLAATPIMLIVPMKLSSASISSSRPVRKLPPMRLAIMLAV